MMFEKYGSAPAWIPKLIVAALLSILLSVMIKGEEDWLIKSALRKHTVGGCVQWRALYWTKRHTSAKFSHNPNHQITHIQYFPLDKKPEALAEAKAYRRSYQESLSDYQIRATKHRMEAPLRSCEAAAESSSGAAAASKAALAESRASTASALGGRNMWYARKTRTPTGS
jgi:hypothetical protein